MKKSFVVFRGCPACKQMSQTGEHLPMAFLAKPQAGLLRVLLKCALLEEELKDSASLPGFISCWFCNEDPFV